MVPTNIDSMTRDSRLSRIQAFLVALGIVAICSTGASARNLYKSQDAAAAKTLSTEVTVEPIVRVHRAGSFKFAIPNDGTLGSGFIGRLTDPITGIVIPSFEFPKESYLEYLFAGALWVGATSGGDTLVSIAADGWSSSCPQMLPSSTYPGVGIVSGFADENLETRYSDSVSSNGECTNFSAPLGITVRQRSLAWQSKPNDDFAIIEYHITSTNSDTLKDLYVGLYIDADVGHLTDNARHIDDITGFLPENGIAYIADIDGQMSSNPDTMWTERSARAVIGAKILDVKCSGVVDLNPPSYNWWISNGNPEYDFGPRMAGTESDPFRDFGGFLGTPEGLANKYYILSHPEQDYDQIFTAVDQTANGWLPPPSGPGFAADFADGFDARFLISQGGISLAPGDSMVFVVAIAIGDNFHVNPRDFADSFDPLNPDVFYDKLDFTDLKANIAAAESLYASGYDVQIVSPPPKPTLDDKLADEPLMSWIFSANPSVENYDVYLAKAPDSAVLCQYALIDTPTFVPENIIATVATDTFRLTGLEDGAWYAAAVAVHTSGDSAPPISEPVVFKYGIPHRPTWDSSMFLSEDQLKFRYVSSGPSVSLSWKTEDTDIEHFNLYRLPDSMNFFDPLNFVRVRPSDNGECFIFPGGGGEVICSKVNQNFETVCLTSILPKAQVPGDDMSFTEFPGSPSKHIYGVSAVDSAGNESAMSGIVFAYTSALNRDKAAVILNDTLRTTNISTPVSRDMYLSYQRLLAPYEPDYLVKGPSRLSENEWPPKYSTMAKYKTVIVDGSSRIGLLHGYSTANWAEGNWLVDYVRTGGTVVSVGTNFASSRSFETPPQLVLTRYDTPISISTAKFGRDIFGLDSIKMIPEPLSDSALMFYLPIGASSEASSGFPDLTYHHSGLYTSPQRFTEGPIPYKGVMFPRAENTEVLYTWVGGRDTVSDFEGLPIGVKYTPETHTAYVLISSPWEWELEQAQAFFARIHGDFQTDVTDDEQESTLPKTFALGQNFPNPFNPTTQISYSVPRRSEVSLVVYNILGQKVRTLVDDVKEAGEHVVTWDAGEFASGMYFYRLNAGETKISRKMVLLK